MTIDYTWFDALRAFVGCVFFWLIGYGMGFKAASREADRMTALLAAKARGERVNVRN
jgi:hypothetical protein